MTNKSKAISTCDQISQSNYSDIHDNAEVPKIGRFLVGKTIGKGSFGKVRLGLDPQTGNQVAIKIFYDKGEKDGGEKETGSQ